MGARACTPLAARSGSRVLSTRHRSTCLRRASLVFVSLPPLAQLALVHPQTQETPQQPKRLTWERKESPEEFKEPPERGPCARALFVDLSARAARALARHAQKSQITAPCWGTNLSNALLSGWLCAGGSAAGGERLVCIPMAGIVRCGGRPHSVALPRGAAGTKANARECVA